MAEDRQPKDVDELEQYFDEALSRLRVSELPLQLALTTSLAISEDLIRTATKRIPDRFSADAAMLHYKSSLEILIPYLFKKCEPQVTTNQSRIIDQSQVDIVLDALHFCERYDLAVHCYTLYHQKQFSGSLSSRVADFQFSSGINIGRSSLNLLLHNYRDQMTLNQYTSSFLTPPSISPDALIKIRSFTDVREVLYSTPNEIYIPIHKIVEATMPRPTVDFNASCGNYSIGDCYKVWLEFMTRMLAYIHTCEEKSKIDNLFNLLNHRTLQLTLLELSVILSDRGTIPYNMALSVLSDFVFDNLASHPDILIQPLVPMSNGRVLIAPLLIFTANWEVCVLRNWTRLYPKLYGAIIGSKKTELAQSLGRALSSNRFVISTNKKLTGAQGQMIGDIDVAVFDPSDGFLVLFEVKWLIEPDSTKETIKSDLEIAHGIDQARKYRNEFENNKARFLRQVFPQNSIEISSVKEHKSYIIVHGNVGTKDDEKNNIYILDYLLSTDIISSSNNLSLRQILLKIENKQKEISNSIEKISRPLRVKLAGYLLRLPGYGLTLPKIGRSSGTEQPGRNDPCICGSGRKYKKCCLNLDSYSEDIVEQ